MRAGIRGRLRLELDGSVLVAANTGAPMDAAGVESASTLRASSKRSGETVGRFGVGFAAVLAVTDEPAIMSDDAGVRWSLARTLAELAEIPSLKEEVARRGNAVPVLRLPFADEPVAPPPAGFDTKVVLPLRDEQAVALVRELLDGVDAALLLTLPALESVEVIVDGVARELRAEPAPGGVVVDGVRWLVRESRGGLDPELLRDRPVEERSQREFSVVWAVPVDDRGVPVALPSSVPAVVHAPTPTDEPLALPALLIATFPLDPTRRHVAAGALRDFLLDRAASSYAAFVREMPVALEVLDLVPTGVAIGALDGALREGIVDALQATAFLPSSEDGVRARPEHAVMLDAADDAVTGVLAEVLPALVPGSWARRGRAALRVLRVREVSLAEVIDDLAGLEKPAAWWKSLYAALDSAWTAPELLAGLPVPLSAGGLARSPRGLVMPGAAADLEALGLRGVDPDAAHPLLVRLGAVEPDPAAILAGERVRAAVENSYDAEDPSAIADAVLALVSASGLSAAEHPWLAELALPAADGELYAAGELLLPGGQLAPLVIEDSPFGVVDAALVEAYGADVLKAVGVLDGFALVRDFDVVDADHDLDGEPDYFEAVAEKLDAAASVSGGVVAAEPASIGEFVAVRDLEFVRADAWPAALRMLATPPWRAAVVDRVTASTSAKRARVLPYTAWWLRRHGIVRGRLSSSDPLLEGLHDIVELDLDDEFLVAAGALREVGDADPDDLTARLADPARTVTRAQVREIYARVRPDRPPLTVRGVRHGELVAVDADDAVVVDLPDLLPLLGDLAIVPASLDHAERVADALALPLASELGAFEVRSSGTPRDDHIVHDRLLVDDVDGVPTRAPWRLVDGVLHVDAGAYERGLGRGRAWRAGNWAARHLETELLRDPAEAEWLLAEADLDSPAPGYSSGR